MTIKQCLRRAQWHYFISLGVLLSVALLIKFAHLNHLYKGELSQAWQLGLQTACLLLFMMMVPLNLLWFNRRCQNIRQLETAEARIAAYSRIQCIRLFLLDAIVLCPLCLLVAIGMPQAKMLFYMSLVFFAFIIPSRQQLMNDVQVDEEGDLIDPSTPTEPATHTEESDSMEQDCDDDFIPKNPTRSHGHSEPLF